jgi:hypothetical protein
MSTVRSLEAKNVQGIEVPDPDRGSSVLFGSKERDPLSVGGRRRRVVDIIGKCRRGRRIDVKLKRLRRGSCGTPQRPPGDTRDNGHERCADPCRLRVCSFACGKKSLEPPSSQRCARRIAISSNGSTWRGIGSRRMGIRSRAPRNWPEGMTVSRWPGVPRSAKTSSGNKHRRREVGGDQTDPTPVSALG